MRASETNTNKHWRSEEFLFCLTALVLEACQRAAGNTIGSGILHDPDEVAKSAVLLWFTGPDERAQIDLPPICPNMVDDQLQN